MAKNKTEATQKEQIVAQLISTGMTAEQAEAQYNKLFSTDSGSVKLPFPLLKFNNVAGVADIGQLVANPVKDDSGDTVSYETVLNTADVEFTIITKKAMWGLQDQATGRSLVKTRLLDTMVGGSNFIDVNSGKSIQQLKDEGLEPKYQVLAVVGVRPKDTTEAFTYYNMFIKGAVLYGLNRLFDTYANESAYSIANIAVKIGKQGAVRYTEIDLEASESRPFTTDDTLSNLTDILDVVQKQDAYVEAYNKQVEESAPQTATPAAGLPE